MGNIPGILLCRYMRSTHTVIKDAATLVVISCVLGIMAQFVLPNGISVKTELTTIQTDSAEVVLPSISIDPNGDLEASNITLRDAYEIHQKGSALFLDAREPEAYKQGHIAGAVNLPADAFMDSLTYLEGLDPDTLIISYCDGSECNASIDLAANLDLMGFTQVRFFFGGWEEWIGAGHPMEGGSE